MELIYSKTVDKSVLWDGFSIQSCLLHPFTEVAGRLAIGEKKEIRLMLGNKIYEGIALKNQAFNREKYPTHKEMYQVRYSPKSEFPTALRVIYSDLWKYIEQEMEFKRLAKLRGEKTPNIKLPENLQFKIAFYTTSSPDVWMVETYTATDNDQLKESVKSYEEISYEQTDEDATIREDLRKVKLRILDRKIGNNLKRLYNHTCQVCGQRVWEHYGETPVIEAHHILPFTQSLNNNYDNIMIMCPTHHRIIHACHGEFKRSHSEIHYPNGLRERLSLNLHL